MGWWLSNSLPGYWEGETVERLNLTSLSHASSSSSPSPSSVIPASPSSSLGPPRLPSCVDGLSSRIHAAHSHERARSRFALSSNCWSPTGSLVVIQDYRLLLVHLFALSWGGSIQIQAFLGWVRFRVGVPSTSGCWVLVRWWILEMVDHYLPSSVSAPKLVDQLAALATTMNSLYSFPKSRSSGRAHRNRKPSNSPSCPNFPACPHVSTSAVIDVVVLIAVLGAFGFLLYPSVKFVVVELIVAIEVIFSAVKDEICHAPLIYGSLGLSVLFAALAMWALVMCTMSRLCGNPNCRGLRKAAEFDIQIETEDCVKNSSAPKYSNISLFKLPVNRQQELEAELRKMAPPNGRAILVFRARCGCSAGILEVPGPKKLLKIKK